MGEVCSVYDHGACRSARTIIATVWMIAIKKMNQPESLCKSISLAKGMPVSQPRALRFTAVANTNTIGAVASHSDLSPSGDEPKLGGR